jgi:hypothetical protein
MRKILIIGLALIGLTGCNNNGSSDNSNQSSESENSGVELIIGYNSTQKGISIIKLETGERFIYCETPYGVAIEQIKSEVNPIETTPLDTTTIY